jgi:hypothetical protein
VCRIFNFSYPYLHLPSFQSAVSSQYKKINKFRKKMPVEKEECVLLRYNVASLGNQFVTFYGNIKPSFSRV